jgi:hypothetical protein
MALFDLSNLKGMFGSPSPDGGWSSGTTTNPAGAFFSRDASGGISGLTPGRQSTFGKAFMAAGQAMPGGYKAPQGAFSDPQAQADPNSTSETISPWHDLISAWKTKMKPGGQV